MKLNKMVFDDKKIEEAARRAADLYEQDLPMMKTQRLTVSITSAKNLALSCLKMVLSGLSMSF